jgi:hypothetical protein
MGMTVPQLREAQFLAERGEWELLQLMRRRPHYFLFCPRPVA